MFPGHCFRRPGQRGAFAGCTSEKCPKQRGLRGCRPQSEALFGWAGATRGRVRGLRGAVMPGSPPALPCRPPSKPEVRGCRGGHCHLRGPSRVLRGAPFPASAPASRPGPLARLRSWHLLPYRAPFFAVISGGGEGLCVVHRPEPEVFVQRLRITSLWGSQRDRCRAGGGFLRDGNSP